LGRDDGPVLVVEGVGHVREVLADLLTEVGYAVEACSGPHDVLAMLSERGPRRPRVVSTDLHPGQEPYLWLNQIRAHTGAPIVITTRYPRAWFADYAVRGYAGLLSEPFDVRELLARAQSLVPLPDDRS
jgi:DNA-binding response OmpR family regulator